MRMGELKLDHPSEREHKYVQFNLVVSTYIDAHFKKTETAVCAILLLHV